MGRTRSYRRRVRKAKIHRRKEMILACTPYEVFYRDKLNKAMQGEKEGIFSKCHYGTLGHGEKTKTKNSYASYRHKGGYGKALKLSRHDKTRIIAMQDELYEYQYVGDM